MASVEVYKENHLIGNFRLNEDFVSIGRSGSNEIVLPDRDLKVSRYHAVLIRNSCDPDGYIKTKMVDVKIIAATSHDLHRDMEGGKFRSDLYYRFGTRILIPPLNKRRNDIPLLAHYFLDKYSGHKELRWRGITAQAMHSLLSYSWPGNVRELESTIENALSRSDGVICLQRLPAKIQHLPSKGPDAETGPTEKRSQNSLEDMEKSHIMEILNHTTGNKEKAVKILKIRKPALYDKIKRFGIPVDFGKRD